MKGGVGKTTLAVNLAHSLAENHRKKVLLIDLDPQFNATQYLMKENEFSEYMKLVHEGNRRTVYDIFKKTDNVIPSVAYGKGRKFQKTALDLKNITFKIPTIYGSLSLIPSHLELMELLNAPPGTEVRLKRFVKKFAIHAFDYIILDCPPEMSIFTLSAFGVSDAILIPIKPDFLSSFGLPLLRRFIEDYKEDSDNEPKELGIVFTMVHPNTRLMKEMMKEVQESMSEEGLYVFSNKLRNSTAIAKAAANNLPILKYKEAKAHWNDMSGITVEFLERVTETID